MKKLKFRYRFKHHPSGNEVTHIYTVNDLESGAMERDFGPEYAILSRDEYVTELHGEEVYIGDTIQDHGFHLDDEPCDGCYKVLDDISNLPVLTSAATLNHPNQ